MKIAILQSNYLPWTGVFELIDSVDKFVFYDNVQFTKQDWRTRNKIKTDNDNLWLSVPIQRQKLKTNIVDIKICNEINWKKKHYKSFCQYYSKSKYFNEYKYLLDFYLLEWEYLYKLNRYTTEKISRALNIDTKFYYSEDFEVSGNPTEKIIQVVNKLGGDTYISGKAGRNYINESLFTDIKLEYMEYRIENKFTVLDNIFNDGVNIL
ncbi:hypothetical protein CMI38_06735 [Candidatus Pacearchaeota archaeon]|jgi:hypothetical protein|nr:hypothetical protein [Candidatus Pacearchaeota archaeon]|tara:strand:- start:2465 stop:3088 length:624 start_codon:yes stop_codon:yes gene_type:complete